LKQKILIMAILFAWNLIIASPVEAHEEGDNEYDHHMDDRHMWGMEWSGFWMLSILLFVIGLTVLVTVLIISEMNKR